MSKRLQVIQAVKALVEAALPGAKVLGLAADEEAPSTVPATGRVIVRSGDPGEAEVDLSPLRYNYRHAIPIEVAAYQSAGVTSEEAVDAMLTTIGTAIAADRELGGLVEWLDAEAPATSDIYVDGANPPRGADTNIIAEYWTATPLT